MMRAATLFVACVALITPWPALAQPASDPIGAILDRPGQMTPELDEPDTASQGSRQVPAPAVRTIPGTPTPVQPPPPRLSAPTHLEETGRNPDAPPSVKDLAYESRIRSSIASAQSFQGPLDGGWVLSLAGRDAYSLQLVDKGRGVVEGAWRDLRRQGAVGASGFVDQVESQGPDLTLRFTTADNATVEVDLHAGGYGAWSGDYLENGQRRPAQMRRKN